MRLKEGGVMWDQRECQRTLVKLALKARDRARDKD